MTKNELEGGSCACKPTGSATIYEAPNGLTVFGADLTAIEIANHEHGISGRADAAVEPCEGCPKLFLVTPRQGIPDGRYCAFTQRRANFGRCIARHLPVRGTA